MTLPNISPTIDVSPDGRSVTLPTLAQHGGVTYTVLVAGVTSQVGALPLQIGWAQSFNVAEFVGSYEHGKPQDSDGDGIGDAREQLGFYTEVVQADGNTRSISTSSSPWKCDTDGDGSLDGQEWAWGSDP